MTAADSAALSATGLLLVAAGVAIVVVARRAAQGRIGRNQIAGIRTAATLASDEAWLAAHRAGEPLMRLGGWLCALTGAVTAVLAWLELDNAWLLGAVLLGGTALVLVAVIGSAARGQRAARAVGERARGDADRPSA
ncbi:SdpI family protein [Ruania suaedae]|uniref:SdpI family protein n=1 Tax=Ruania suaedae TaxID=2897774 RepID=UPI001E4E0E0B|nr:SdpI family protein [Ruania suaedae]UFU02053.1 SdpI family protein [Ruania suaedae]